MEQLALSFDFVSNTKKCSKCKLIKDKSEFYKSKKNSSGLMSECKVCNKIHTKKYYELNKEKISIQRVIYCQKNKEKIAEAKKEYANKNYEKISEYKKEWCEKNKERLLAQKKEYYQKNKETRKIKSSDYYQRNKEKIKNKVHQYRINNLEKIKETGIKYRKKNADSLKIVKAEYQKNNIEKIRITKAKYREKNSEAVSALKRNYKARKRSADGNHSGSDIKRLFLSQGGLCVGCGERLVESGSKRYHVDHIIPLSKGGTNWPHNLQLLCVRCNTSKGDKMPEEWLHHCLISSWPL